LVRSSGFSRPDSRRIPAPEHWNGKETDDQSQQHGRSFWRVRCRVSGKHRFGTPTAAVASTTAESAASLWRRSFPMPGEAPRMIAYQARASSNGTATDDPAQQHGRSFWTAVQGFREAPLWIAHRCRRAHHGRKRILTLLRSSKKLRNPAPWKRTGPPKFALTRPMASLSHWMGEGRGEGPRFNFLSLFQPRRRIRISETEVARPGRSTRS